MQVFKEAPDIFVVSPNRSESYGVVKNIINLESNIRFGTINEITFTVPEKYYNTEAERWETTTLYNDLDVDTILYLTDEERYYKYPIRTPGNANFYRYCANGETPQSRSTNSLTLNQNINLTHWKVQPEATLFDIGQDEGRTFYQFKFIDYSTGSIKDYTATAGFASGVNYANLVACPDFIPVSFGDVISLNGTGSKDVAGGSKITGNWFNWHVAFYTNNDASTYQGYRTCSNPNVTRIPVREVLPEGGYVRFYYTCNSENGNGYYYRDKVGGGYEWGYTYPIFGYAKIYSGDRHCKSVDLSTSSGYYFPRNHWFVIANTEESNNGIYSSKTITAYSYEYTIKNKTVSFAENTMALYTPPEIVTMVSTQYTTGTPEASAAITNGVRWEVDNVSGVSYYSAQKMAKGLLNQVIERLPDWSIGHISSKLMSTYRTIESVDDINIYSFLTSTVQPLYNCFIVFDSDNRTISAYTQADLFAGSDRHTNIHLTWDNAIKQIDKDNKDVSNFTALRVHSSDDTYGLGLINPTGNNIIYNFNYVGTLDYYPDGQCVRTLKTALDEWVTEYESQREDREGSYRTYGLNLIGANLQLVQLDSALSKALAEYRAKADEINAILKDNYSNSPDILTTYLLPDTPLSAGAIQNRLPMYTGFESMRSELLNLACTYSETKTLRDSVYQSIYSTNTSNLGYIARMQSIARNLTLDYYTALTLNDGDIHSNTNTILSAVEILALDKYIKEGSWKDENSVFSSTYGADDIVSTLEDLYSAASNDLESRLTKQNYDFTVNSANIVAIKDFETQIKNLWVGSQFYLHLSDTEVVSPILLEMHINYKDPNDFSFTFTTDMKRKPMQFRFADLYSTIAQTNVTDSAFSFDD